MILPLRVITSLHPFHLRQHDPILNFELSKHLGVKVINSNHIDIHLGGAHVLKEPYQRIDQTMSVGETLNCYDELTTSMLS